MQICIDKIQFNYSSETILNKVSLDILSGECLAILGPNGAGKTTLLKCINRLLKYKNGTIKLDGENLQKLHCKELAKKIGYVPQSTNNIFPIKVIDMVLLGRNPYIDWNGNASDIAIALDSLKTLNIENLAMKNFNEISGGQQQKVVIARTLAQKTMTLLLDEPISNLDIRQQLSVMDVVKELVGSMGITAVMVLHDLNIAGKYADKIVLMKHGQIFAAGTPKEVLSEDNLSAVYGIKVKIDNIEGKPYIIPLRVK